MENSSRQRRSFIVETASVSGGRSHSGCSKVASFLTHKCIRHAPAVVWMQNYFEIVTSIPELCEICYSKLRVNQNTRAKPLAQMSSIKRKRGRKITEDALNDSMRMKCEESIWPANPATLQWVLVHKAM
ncbi:hypothetical protein T12_417 [Trichinella patagoniensis]|uniref:Uncharacterized protein n=1 Tax=Trichinella patagoniensis TaxID=990121 RepID=A0A0V0Z5E9_9BILA|nr:hypothetical protein T12_417 [Trichinella patagoniensis]